MDDRDDIVRSLRGEGRTLAAIASVVGLSQSRVHQILAGPSEKDRQSRAIAKWRASEKGKATKKRNDNTYQTANIDQVRALRRVQTSRWYKAHPEKRKPSDPERAKAYGVVRRAIAAGRLVPQPCGDCGTEKVQAHHCNGYVGDAALDVVWLCAIHHAVAHGRTKVVR